MNRCLKTAGEGIRPQTFAKAIGRSQLVTEGHFILVMVDLTCGGALDADINKSQGFTG
jgi:hypothetical protein